MYGDVFLKKNSTNFVRFFKKGKQLRNPRRKKVLEFPLAEMAENNILGKTTEMTRQKLKDHYNSQDKLVPLFDDPPQSVSHLYVRLAILAQQQVQERKGKTSNKNNKERKGKMSNKNNEEKKGKSKKDQEWSSTVDYSLIYGEQILIDEKQTLSYEGQKTIELEDIWKVEKSKKKEKDIEGKKLEEEDELELRHISIHGEEESELKLRHISIHGEAGTGKSVLSQRIAYLWANNQIWNDRFQLLLHIPLRKIANIFDEENNDKIEKQWTKIMKELNIPHCDENDTKCIMRAKDGLLLVLDGFDEIVNELNTKLGLRQWLQLCISNTNYSIIMTSRPNAMCSYLDNKVRRLSVIGFQTRDIQNYVYVYFRNITNDVNNNHQANALIRALHCNSSLQLLSHTPLEKRRQIIR
ncbi:NTPase [Reticulomyxa filosa]|uniref:NTPase n=1 Tax=Reticulomyxa filosa TaxID=46433 RepID=X6M911_RETFI|nr:NTPase [Reticulomyxa filosa]|eukprot:ETO10483.1 NTPase [Reticulomyxa filosa]